MNKQTDAMIQAFEALTTCVDTINTTMREPKHTVNVLTEYVEGLFSFSLFKEGDEIQLNDTWEESFAKRLESGADGWKHCSHFLINGAVGEVVDVDFSDGHFRYDIMFDNESWVTQYGIDRGKINPVPRKKRHTFNLHEKYLMASGDVSGININDV